MVHDYVIFFYIFANNFQMIGNYLKPFYDYQVKENIYLKHIKISHYEKVIDYKLFIIISIASIR